MLLNMLQTRRTVEHFLLLQGKQLNERFCSPFAPLGFNGDLVGGG